MTGQHAQADGDAVVRSLEENFWSLWSRFGLGDGCALHETEEATWFDTPLPMVPYNAVIRFHDSDDADQRIDEIFEHYESRQVPCVWLVHPTASPADLSARLAARGLEELEVLSGMAMDLSGLAEPAPPAGDVEIEQVEGSDAAGRFLELISWRWQVPPEWLPAFQGVTRALNLSRKGARRGWTANINGKPVAKVMLNLAAGVAGIYGVSTRPEARGKGLATTLTSIALDDARREGYTRAILHSTPVARGLYERMGFRACADFRAFGPPGALHG